MNTPSVIRCTVLLFCLALSGTALPQIAITPEYRLTSVQREKCGQEEFLSNCLPLVRKYRSQQDHVEIAVDKSVNSNVVWTGTLTVDSTTLYDAQGVCTNLCTNAVGTCDLNGVSGSGDCSGWTLTYTNRTDFLPSFESIPSCPGPSTLLVADEGCVRQWWMGSPTENLSSTVQRVTNSYPPFTPITELGYEIGGRYYITRTLSDEFTTEQLLFPPLAFADDWQQGSIPAASVAISGDEQNAGITAVRARFKMNAPKATFVMPYVLRLHFDGYPEILRTNGFICHGNGCEEYFPSGEPLALNAPVGLVEDGNCRHYIGGTATLQLLDFILILDGPDAGCAQKTSCLGCDPGMATWWVTEPYCNLWAMDKPVVYTTSLGEQIDFSLY